VEGRESNNNNDDDNDKNNQSSGSRPTVIVTDMCIGKRFQFNCVIS